MKSFTVIVGLGMLRAVIISPDMELTSSLTDVITRAGKIGLVKTTDRYLVSFELERFLRANGPQVIFLGIEQLSKAIEIVHGIETAMPGAQIVAIDRTCDPVLSPARRSAVELRSPTMADPLPT